MGEAVKESGIPRSEIWITSKLWPTEYGEGKTLKAIDEMLDRMQLDYIDLLYVHQPVGDFVGAWKDMEKAVKMGKVRALGISNFDANDEVFNEMIAEAHGKSPAQIILRWHIQEGFSVIPGATNPDYIKENIQIFNFALTDDEMQAFIDAVQPLYDEFAASGIEPKFEEYYAFAQELNEKYSAQAE